MIARQPFVPPRAPRPGVAVHIGDGKWKDGAGIAITGECPLAQLGVGGRYQDAAGNVYPKGHLQEGQALVWTIIEIDTTTHVDAKGRPFVAMRATS